MEELQKIVSKCVGSVLYMPTKSEVDYNDSSFPIKIPKDIIILPRDKKSNPFELADSCITKFKNDPVCVLIPGTRFDIYGTRYGRSGGWYDRFLSRIPSNWLRIGVIDITKFSDSKLARQEWDEPVQWIIVQNGISWSVKKSTS